MIKKILLFLLLASFAVGNAGAATPASSDEHKQLSTSLSWKLSLDADGSVTSLTAEGESVAALREKLEAEIRNWEFEPGQVDGKPAPTETLLTVEVGLVPSAEGSEYAVRIKRARTGGSIADASVAPRFPAASMTSLLRSGDSYLQVVVEVRYDAAGKAVAIAPASSSPIQEGTMLESVRKAVKRWTFQPELIAGIGVPGSVFVPVCFMVARDVAKARQNSKRCGWTAPGTEVSISEGESLALDSTVTLKTNISERLL